MYSKTSFANILLTFKNFTKILITVTIFLTIHPSSNAQVIFDGNIESGNINTVTTTDSILYTVTTKTDIGGRWFYFRMINVKDRYVRVRVSSSDVVRAVYSYDNINYERFTAAESPAVNYFQKTYAKDTVYVAYYIPYNYSFLQQRINDWKQSQYVKVDTIGITSRNLLMQEIRITDTTVPDSSKIRVWIHARTHPGETPTSWHFEGIIKKLLEDNPVIQKYREKIVFHCIPFTNPEGVFYGRSRTNFDGVDVESNWNKSDAQTSQEVKILKQRMSAINSEKVMSVFLNLHSQAAPYCTFWIHTASSTSDFFYRREMQFSNLNTSDNPYFVQSDYRFSNLSSTFPEGWLWNNHGDKVMALTYETPYDFYSNNELVTIENLNYLGERTVYAIAEYLEINHPRHLIIDNSNVAHFWDSESVGNEFYSDDYITTQYSDGRGPVKFESELLESGNYDVYAWWPTNPNFAYDVKYHIEGGGSQIDRQKNLRISGGQWNYLATLDLPNSGQISVTVSDSASGRVVADAFRVIYRGAPQSIKEDLVLRDFVLYQNYPNPFNPSTTIRFLLNTSDNVKLQVFNTLGQEVTTLVDEFRSSGNHEVIFDATKSGISSGIYYYRLIVGDKAETKGMIVLK
ncbi:MAG: T9SS type A sorting domain-containing protein [Ignavibacteriaceae bacterium]|nr:T9SS type A sorting domain-containing protein [Ignavibacteriaceae bacterium]